jgi:antitoxin component YwqK of YwqJK toxin-antitoxin module
MVGLWRRVHLESDHPWFNTNDFRGFTPPLISSAEFVDGQLNGSWLIKDRQERKIVELNYRSGKRHGAGSWWFPNGQLRRQLQFEEDLLHGLWQEWNVEGQLQTENWFLEGQRIDKEINYFAANRPESEQSFLDGQLTLDGQDDWWNARLATYQRTGQRIQTGPVKAWYDNGQRHMAGYYKDGLRHGEFAWWHANGNRKLICNYQNGQRVGKWVWWHENGIKAAEGSYVDDLPAGEWLAWNEQGEITNSRDWEADRQSVARPTFEPPPADLELEELPAQKGLEAPLIPSLDQVELPPPTLNDTPPASGDSEVELDGPAGGSDVDPPPRPAGDQPAID